MSRVSAPDGTVLDLGQGYLDHIQAIQYCNAEIRVYIPRVRPSGRRHDENHGRRHRQPKESPFVNETDSSSPRFPARFNELPWYRSNVPCMEACPVHTDSGRYVQLIAEGRFEDAFLVARAPNPLASVCGRVCSAPCEDACRRAWVDEAVTIRLLAGRLVAGPEPLCLCRLFVVHVNPYARG